MTKLIPRYQHGNPFLIDKSSIPGTSPQTSSTINYDWNRQAENKEAIKQAEKERALQQYLDRRGYISEDKDRRSYQRREFDNDIQNIVDQTISQKASPGNVDFNTVETGISKGLQFGMIPEAVTQALARPAATLLGTAGYVDSNIGARLLTGHNTLGKAISPNNILLSSTIDVLNPFGLIGGWYGNGVDKRLAEVLVRRGDSLYQDISTIRTGDLFKHMFPPVSNDIKKSVRNNHPILSYILNPRQKDLIYKINKVPEQSSYYYSGNTALKGTITHKGDIVDIFFNKGINNTGFNYTREIPTFFADYMAKNYPHKRPYWFRIGEASVDLPEALQKQRNASTCGVSLFPKNSSKPFIDPGGFRVLEETPEVNHYADIWKFNGKDALLRYGSELSSTPHGKSPSIQSKYYKPLIKAFGNFIDAHSTPIITQWYDTRPLFQNIKLINRE